MAPPYSKLKIILFFLSVLLVCPQACKDQEENLYPEAERQNIDGVQITRAFADASKIADLQGLAVARNGVVVAEAYFNDATSEPGPPLHVMSVTKSITSTLVGIAIEEGFIDSVGQTISDFLGAEVDTVNPALGKVTIRQLLTTAHGQQLAYHL